MYSLQSTYFAKNNKRDFPSFQDHHASLEPIMYYNTYAVL